MEIPGIDRPNPQASHRKKDEMTKAIDTIGPLADNPWARRPDDVAPVETEADQTPPELHVIQGDAGPVDREEVQKLLKDFRGNKAVLTDQTDSNIRALIEKLSHRDPTPPDLPPAS